MPTASQVPGHLCNSAPPVSVWFHVESSSGQGPEAACEEGRVLGVYSQNLDSGLQMQMMRPCLQVPASTTACTGCWAGGVSKPPPPPPPPQSILLPMSTSRFERVRNAPVPDLLPPEDKLPAQVRTMGLKQPKHGCNLRQDPSGWDVETYRGTASRRLCIRLEAACADASRKASSPASTGSCAWTLPFPGGGTRLPEVKSATDVARIWSFTALCRQAQVAKMLDSL